MKQIVIENPVLNSPFEEPKRHFKFTEDGITDEIIGERRISQYFIPIPQPKKRSAKQLSFAETGWTSDRVEENKDINRIREADQLIKLSQLNVMVCSQRPNMKLPKESLSASKTIVSGKNL